MSSSSRLPIQVFDPSAEVAIVERRLPHWSQAGAIGFITFRTHDSMPRRVLTRWFADRDRWLRQREIALGDRDMDSILGSLAPATAAEFREVFGNRWNDELDACHGDCVLRRPELSKIVADSLHYFDERRYVLLDYVIMHNHVHLLSSFPDGEQMLPQCESWKRYTAVRINRQLGKTGRFWQQDGFDHLVRSEEQFQQLRRYIAENPTKARLAESEFRHYSKPLPAMK